MSLSWPVEGKVTQTFGSNPNSIQPNGHTGVDFGIPVGTPIYAADSGNIAFEGWATQLSSNNPWWLAPAYAGIVVVINHNDGYITIYGHLESTVINNNQFVEKGQLIGYSGSTGLSTGPHLHFEVAGWPLQPYNGFYGRLNPHNGLVTGFAAVPAVAGHQRISSTTVNQRSAPNRSAAIINSFGADTILDFKGFVRGENVDGNDIWYAGAYSDTYFWSGGFTDSSTNGLADLTPVPVTPPAPSLLPTQRKVGAAVIRYRKAPNTSADIIIEYQPGDVLNFSQWTQGESVNGNNKWFKGALSGGYAWSGGFEDQSVNGLTEEVITAPTPAPTPVPPSIPEKYSFTPDFDFVEYIPAALPNFMFGNFPEKPTHAVIHQFGTPGVDTLNSTINTFTNPNMERVASSHFVVSGKRIIQMVSLKDRAYHAGAVGNNYVGIETDPRQDPDTIESTKKLLAALNAHFGYELTKIRHKDVQGNATTCGSLINLDLYTLQVPVTPPVIQPPVEVPVTPPVVETPPQPSMITPEIERQIIEKFLKHQLDQYFS